MVDEIKPLATRIEQMVAGIPGWTPTDQLCALWQIVTMTTGLPGDVLEIGSWCGRSSVVLASAALAGGSRVHCVDLFPAKSDWKRNDQGEYYFAVEIGNRRVAAYDSFYVWPEVYQRDMAPLYERYGSIYEAFIENVAKAGLRDAVVPFRGDISMFAAAQQADFRCRVAFIDGDHGYDAVCNDIVQVERFLVPGGWICLDDAFASYDGVNRAIEERILRHPDYELAQQLTRKLFVARRKSGGGVAR